MKVVNLKKSFTFCWHLSKQVFTILSILIFSFVLNAQQDPWIVVKEMGRGINVGNTLEAPNEGEWAKAVEEYYFDDYVKAGFSCVRIPVRWDTKTSKTSPYTIASTYLNRVEQVVDWALERNLYVILNAHHEYWIKDNYSNPLQRARFDSIWSQIAVRFKNKSEKLLFEILNEPINMSTAQVNDLNSRLIPLIRKTNPARIIIYSGNDYSGLANLKSASIPNDDNLIGYFHSYDPWSFAGEGKGTWTETNKPALVSMFAEAASWSKTNNIPVIISEFGAVKSCDYNSRMRHYATYTEEALRNGIAFQVWDDAGDFGIYDRVNRNFHEVADILTKASPDGPTALNSTLSDEVLTLSWKNRTSDNDSIFIERRINNGGFQKIASLAPSATSYKDSGFSAGANYYYRIVSYFNDSVQWYSYPYKFYKMPDKRSPYSGEASIVPGTVEAENFDLGGELLTYHDTETENKGGAYRITESVDIEYRATDKGYQIGYVAAGEWIEYSILVQKAGTYEISAQVASMNGGGKFNFQFGATKTANILVPATGSWTTTKTVKSRVNLSEGQQVMRVNVVSEPGFNLDRFVFTEITSTDIAEVNEVENIEVFPNPFVEFIKVKIEKTSKASIYNTSGILLHSFIINEKESKLDLKHLTAGTYIIFIQDKYNRYSKLIIKQ